MPKGKVTISKGMTITVAPKVEGKLIKAAWIHAMTYIYDGIAFMKEANNHFAIDSIELCKSPIY